MTVLTLAVMPPGYMRAVKCTCEPIDHNEETSTLAVNPPGYLRAVSTKGNSMNDQQDAIAIWMYCSDTVPESRVLIELAKP